MMPTNGLEILLIEDNADDAEFILRALKKTKLVSHTTSVRNGAEALDYLYRRGKYAEHSAPTPLQLILLDLKLPDMTGLDILRQIKANEHTQAVPIVVVTASQAANDKTESERLGINGYIEKSVDVMSFISILQETCVKLLRSI